MYVLRYVTVARYIHSQILLNHKFEAFSTWALGNGKWFGSYHLRTSFRKCLWCNTQFLHSTTLNTAVRETCSNIQNGNGALIIHPQPFTNFTTTTRLSISRPRNIFHLMSFHSHTLQRPWAQVTTLDILRLFHHTTQVTQWKTNEQVQAIVTKCFRPSYCLRNQYCI